MSKVDEYMWLCFELEKMGKDLKLEIGDISLLVDTEGFLNIKDSSETVVVDPKHALRIGQWIVSQYRNGSIARKTMPKKGRKK